MGTIPNRGDAGDALDATVTGLVRVQGPAIRFPGGLSGPNSLRAAVAPYSPTAPLFAEFTIDRLTNPGATEASIFGDRFGNRCGAWVRLRGTGAGGIYIARGTAALLSSVNSLAVTPAEVWTETTHWRVTIPVSGTPTALWSLDGETWNDLGASGWSGTLPVSTWESGAGGMGIGTGSGGIVERPMTGSLLALKITEVGGGVVYDLRPSDIAVAAPDATIIVPSVGPATSVLRHTSGPVTTIVPDGVVEYINPDPSNAANKGAVTSLSLVVGADEDMVIGWCGVLGTTPTPFTRLLSMLNFPSTSSVASIYNGNASISIRSGVNDSAGSGQRTASPGAPTVSPSLRPLVCLSVLDRALDTWRSLVFDDTGLRGSNTQTAAAIGEMKFGGIDMLALSPGVLHGALFNKGAGIAPTDAELAVIARRLLVVANREAISSTGALPPAWAPVCGDRWRAENGHVVRFDGAVWQPETPVDGNVAAMIANMQLVIGAAG